MTRNIPGPTAVELDVICPYCQTQAELVDGTAIYPHRKDLAKKVFWRCKPCKAYVGCHDGTPQPFGGLANAALRKARSKAHAAFDPLWQHGVLTGKSGVRGARTAMYRWLGEKMGLPKEKCHIGMMDEAQCAQVVTHCEEFQKLMKKAPG